MKLSQFPETLAVVRFGPGATVPAWAESSTVFSITASATETSVVCAARSVPRKSVHQRAFTAFEVEGPLEFSQTGTLVELLAPLLEAGINAIPVPTYDTYWLLVRTGDVEAAIEAWRRSGHTVEPAVPVAPKGTKK